MNSSALTNDKIKDKKCEDGLGKTRAWDAPEDSNDYNETKANCEDHLKQGRKDNDEINRYKRYGNENRIN